MWEGSLDLKRHKENDSKKILVKSRSLIQVSTRNVLLPKMILSSCFYFAKRIFQAVWYNQFSPFSIIHYALTNSHKYSKNFIWIRLSQNEILATCDLQGQIDRAQEHVIQKLHRKWFVTKRGENAPLFVANNQTFCTEWHSDKDKHREGTPF